ncbi:MAG: antibiotic biosynthesis monooxygenase family protein [Phycisphaerae bacterium]|jgi:quinol monooxygenase YgiN|nr:antibiotic biosynthesis monooxygenase family protein [Phycisphaerae bacterium]
MVEAKVWIRVARETLGEITSIFRGLLGPTVALTGCRAGYLCQDLTDECVVMFTTYWETQEDTDRYLRSELYRAVLYALELSAEAPKVCFHTISETRGMEYVATVRSSDKLS